jgi:hypothetical protein
MRPTLLCSVQNWHTSRSTNLTHIHKCKQLWTTCALLNTDTDRHNDTSHVPPNILLNTAPCQQTLHINVSTVYHTTAMTETLHFGLMHHHAISSSCECHTLYLHQSRQYSTAHYTLYLHQSRQYSTAHYTLYYTNLDSTVQPTTHYAIRYSILLIGYKPVQHVTVLNTVGSCNIMVLYYMYVMLCYVMLRYMLCYVLLCYVMLYYTIIYYILLYYIIILWDQCHICGPSLTKTSLCGPYPCSSGMLHCVIG